MVDQAVLSDVETGKHARVTRNAVDARRACLFVRRRPIREPVEKRCRIVLVAVEARILGANAVENDEKNVRGTHGEGSARAFLTVSPTLLEAFVNGAVVNGQPS